MQKNLLVILILFFFVGCEENTIQDTEPFAILSLEDIKREYAIADSLNLLEDRSGLNLETVVLGIDARNNQTIIRTPLNRGFGCLLFSDYFTILYLNCDSMCCTTTGFWEVDYVGFAGRYSAVGCAPDTVRTDRNDCGCTN